MERKKCICRVGIAFAFFFISYNHQHLHLAKSFYWKRRHSFHDRQVSFSIFMSPFLCLLMWLFFWPLKRKTSVCAQLKNILYKNVPFGASSKSHRPNLRYTSYGCTTYIYMYAPICKYCSMKSSIVNMNGYRLVQPMGIIKCSALSTAVKLEHFNLVNMSLHLHVTIAFHKGSNRQFLIVW